MMYLNPMRRTSYIVSMSYWTLNVAVNEQNRRSTNSNTDPDSHWTNLGGFCACIDDLTKALVANPSSFRLRLLSLLLRHAALLTELKSKNL